MNRNIALLLVAVLAVPSLLGVVAVPGAAQQTTPTDNSTTTTTATSSSSDGDLPRCSGDWRGGRPVSEHARVVSFCHDRDSGQMIVVVESEYEQNAKLIDMVESAEIAESGGAGKPHQTSQLVDEGRSVLRFDAAEEGGGVAVSLSMDGQTVILSTGTSTDLPLDAVTSPLAWVGGIVLAFTLVIAAAYRQIRSEAGEPESAFKKG
jgi:hypothetical protein